MFAFRSTPYIACLTYILFLSTSANAICENSAQLRINDQEYFSVPVIFDPKVKRHCQFVEELMCFAKFNLLPDRYLAFFVYKDEDHSYYGKVVGYSTLDSGKFTLHVSDKNELLTKYRLPRGANILGSIHKDALGRVSLGLIGKSGEKHTMFEQMIGDMSAFSANFNAQFQNPDPTAFSR